MRAATNKSSVHRKVWLFAPDQYVRDSAIELIGQAAFAANQIGKGFALADHMKLIAVDHDLGWAWPAVVVASHDKAVGAGGFNGQ